MTKKRKEKYLSQRIFSLPAGVSSITQGKKDERQNILIT